MWIRTVFLLLLALSLPMPRAAAQRYVVYDLGPGTAFAINNQSQVVGDTGPFLWQNGMRSSLGNSGTAFAINNLGQIAGQANGHAFFYDGTTIYDLGTFGGATSVAYGLNDGGQITGMSMSAPDSQGNQYMRAFLHSGSGSLDPVLDDIGTLGGTTAYSMALNNAGQVAGAATTADGSTHAFFYDGTMHDLGTLPGGTYSEACAMNASGIVTGNALPAQGNYHAFMYNPALTPSFVDLGAITGGTDGYASAVNSAGLVAGYSEADGGVTEHGFVWDSTHGVRDLNKLLDPATGTGWTISWVYGINDAGQIVGTGFRNGVQEAFLLSPFALSSLTLTPSTVPGSKNVTGKVALSAPAPIAITVVLSNTNPAASAPSSLTIPQGASSKTFAITTTPVASSTTGTITATYLGANLSRTLTVAPPGPTKIGFSLNPVTGGTKTVTGKVTLQTPAAVDTSVTLSVLSGSEAIASLPASVTVPANTSFATFPITTNPVASLTPVQIQATVNGGSLTGTLNVRAPVPMSVAISPNPVPGGGSASVTVGLDAVPIADVAVTLTSNNPIVTFPGGVTTTTVTIPAGNKTYTFAGIISTISPASSTKVTISASADGVTKSSFLTVNQ